MATFLKINIANIILLETCLFEGLCSRTFVAELPINQLSPEDLEMAVTHITGVWKLELLCRAVALPSCPILGPLRNASASTRS